MKVLVKRVKRLIEFFMSSKQSERLEDIQKKYPDANKADDNLQDDEPKENIVSFN